jgi:large subunit ribosomal protein L22
MTNIKSNLRPAKTTDPMRYTKTAKRAEQNEGIRPGTRAHLHNYRSTPTKVRQVLDMVRDKHVGEAISLLEFSDREAARTVRKLIESAMANAQHNDGIDPAELYVAACFADEGRTNFRFRPRARGRAGRIRKRTCHITVVLERLPEERLARVRSMGEARRADRARRVTGGRRGVSERAAAAGRETKAHDHALDHDHDHDDVVDSVADVPAEEVVSEDVVADAVDTDTEAVEAVPAEDAADAEEATTEDDVVADDEEKD